MLTFSLYRKNISMVDPKTKIIWLWLAVNFELEKKKPDSNQFKYHIKHKKGQVWYKHD